MAKTLATADRIIEALEKLAKKRQFSSRSRRHKKNNPIHMSDKPPIPCEDESHIHLEIKSDTPHELSENILLSNNLTSAPLVLSPSLLGCSDKDDALPMEMRDSTICELSESTICEMECYHFENMSDTPSELREVIDRSSEAISLSNNLPSPSSVFSYVAIGSMDDETPIMEKFQLVDEDDAITIDDEEIGHMEPNTSTTPTSYEWDYKGNHKGVDDAMIPLVDMKICECLHDIDDPHAMSYASFTFPCDTCNTTIVDHVELVAYDNVVMTTPCYECFTFTPIACNMLNNCSFPCIARNDDNDACYVVTNLMNNCYFSMFVDNNDENLNMFCSKCLQYSSVVASKLLNNCSFQCLVCNNVNMIVNEIAPIAFSYVGDFAYVHVEHIHMFTPHIHHAYNDSLLNANGDMQMKWNIMMDAVFIYHTHTLSICLTCV